MSNMVMVGALLANLPVLPMDAVEAALKGHLPERHKKLLPQNIKALEKGAEFLAVESA
ncbi:MAG: 2-oxoacid:acceptor oxidoreductase family protein [Thermoleophilia bacterium]|nr:2-oxoacid:acceptor oxidoreductase family protein [Thermoleophilia bacterium]